MWRREGCLKSSCGGVQGPAAFGEKVGFRGSEHLRQREQKRLRQECVCSVRGMERGAHTAGAA